MPDPPSPCPHCGRTTIGIRGICPNCGFAKDGRFTVSETRGDIWRPLSDDLSGAFLFALLFAPGLVLLAVAVFFVGSMLLVGVALALLVAPIAVKLLGDEWW
jgi:hypothetical protein